MIKRGPATQEEKNYALRRIIYDILLTTKSIISLENKKLDFTEKEIAKITAVLMARNLNEFLFGTNHNYYDDIHFSDFCITNWQPDSKTNLNDPKDSMITTAQRISKIVGHIVSSKPAPFKIDNEIRGFVIPLIKESSKFVRQCIESGQAKYKGEAKKYAEKANALLPRLEIPLLP